MRMRRKGKGLKGQGGFSLIELLVVITIMGILAAVAIPRFTSVLEEAKVQADESNAHTLKTAAQVYYFEQGDWPDGGAVTTEYDADFLKLLDGIPEDPWKDDRTYTMGLEGNVEPLGTPGTTSPEE